MLHVTAAGTQISATAPPVGYRTLLLRHRHHSVLAPAPTRTRRPRRTTSSRTAPQGPTHHGGQRICLRHRWCTGHGHRHWFLQRSNFTTQVWFVQCGAHMAASNVNVSASGNSLTAISPAVSSSGNWMHPGGNAGWDEHGIDHARDERAGPDHHEHESLQQRRKSGAADHQRRQFPLGSPVWFCATASAAALQMRGRHRRSGEIAASPRSRSSGTSIAVSRPHQHHDGEQHVLPDGSASFAVQHISLPSVTALQPASMTSSRSPKSLMRPLSHHFTRAGRPLCLDSDRNPTVRNERAMALTRRPDRRNHGRPNADGSGSMSSWPSHPKSRGSSSDGRPRTSSGVWPRTGMRIATTGSNQAWLLRTSRQCLKSSGASMHSRGELEQ